MWQDVSDWKFWLILTLFVLFLFWLGFGGQTHEFIGLSPLDPSSPQIPQHYESCHIIQQVTPVQNVLIPHRDIENIPPPPQNIQSPASLPKTPIQFVSRPDKVVLSYIPNYDTIPIHIPQPKENVGYPRSKGESICCDIMEKIYSKPFRRIRPDFLKNPETGHNLELDCYNDELKIAVEYNGIQHYHWPNFTGQSHQQFIQQIRRDEYKYQTCNQIGVYLITVPYHVPHHQIESYIRERLPQ